MRLTTWSFLALAAPLINCGGDYCSNMEQFESNAAQRNGSCNDGVTITVNFSQSACENALSNSCTSGDQSQLAKASSCLNSLPQCTPGTETTFNGDVTSCDGNAQNVTLSCNLALFQAGAPIVSIGFSGSCTATGDTCSKASDCCSGNCGSGNTCS
jgi:hypothetical protein